MSNVTKKYQRCKQSKKVQSRVQSLDRYSSPCLSVQCSNLKKCTVKLMTHKILTHDKNIDVLKSKIEKATNNVAKWLEDSGMAVNASKTEFVTFSYLQKVKVNVLGKEITNKEFTKILGIKFKSDLTWDLHAGEVISRTKQAANILKQQVKYIDENKMLHRTTAFGFSKLYYGAPVWLSPLLLKKRTMKRLLASSTNQIRSSLKLYDRRISYNDFHLLTNRGTYLQMSDYYLQVTLHNIWNDGVPKHLKKNLSNAIYFNTDLNTLAFFLAFF